MDSNFFRPKIIVPTLYLKLEFDTEDQVLLELLFIFVYILAGLFYYFFVYDYFLFDPMLYFIYFLVKNKFWFYNSLYFNSSYFSVFSNTVLDLSCPTTSSDYINPTCLSPWLFGQNLLHIFFLIFIFTPQIWNYCSQIRHIQIYNWLFFFFNVSDFCPALTKLALNLHLNFCVSVCVSGLFFKACNWMIYWFWQPTYPTRCLELGWAVPHSDFLAWMSSATLKNFISGVLSRILMR